MTDLAANAASEQLPRATTLVAPPRTTRYGWLFLLFIGVTVVLFVPALTNRSYNSDEAYVATQAQEMNRGRHLYVDTVDRKPPVVPFLYAATFRIAGTDDIRPVRILAILANAFTALLLAVEAERRFRNRRAPLIAGLLFLGSSAAFFAKDAQTANFEVFMLPMIVAAVLLAWHNRPLASGLALAVATLTKQNAAVTLIPLVWIMWQQGGPSLAGNAALRTAGGIDVRARRISRIALLGAGFLGPIVLAAVYFGPRPFVHWVVTSNDGYLDVRGAFGFAVALMLRQTQYFLFGHLAIVLLAGYALRRRRHDVDLWLWTLSAVVAAASGFRFFGHYFLQLLPPLCLLATGSLVNASRRMLAVVAGVVLVPVLWFGVAAFHQAPGKTEKAATDLAAYVNEHTRPGTPILVWGHLPEVYWYSDRPPATRFATTGFLTGLSGGRPATRVGMQYATPEAWDDFEADLRRQPPALIFDLSTADVRNASTAPPDKFPRFGSFLANRYQPIAVVDGVLVYGAR